jgi:hypothetical protein
MPDIQGFSLNVGISNVMSPMSEIAKQNLPTQSRVVPSETLSNAAVYGKLSSSAMGEAIRSFLKPDITERELNIPSMFFASLQKALKDLKNKVQREKDRKGGQNGEENEEDSDALEEMAEVLEEALADKELCEMFRNLLLAG